MSEPERPIEKALRACARKKREQAPEGWEMHPATRRLLQQEVASQWPRKPAAASSRFGWLLGRGWLRPAGVLGAVAVGAIVLWISMPIPRHGEPARLLAKNELNQNAPAPGESSQPGGAASVSAGRVLEKADTLKQAEREARQLADDARPEPEQSRAFLRKTEQAKDSTAPDRRFQPVASPANSFPMQQPARQPSLASSDSVGGSLTPLAATPGAAPAAANALGGALPPASPAAAPVSAVPQLQAARPSSSVVLLGAQSAPAVPANLEELSGRQANPAGVIEYGYFTASQQSLAQVRNRQLRDNLKEGLAGRATGAQSTQSPKGILSSFRLEQSGQQLRIIDSDQSVYAGPIQTGVFPAAAAGRDEATLVGASSGPPAMAAGATFAQSKAPGQATLQYLFHLVGTNRSSNQKVSITGTLDGVTNQTGPITGRFDSSANKSLATPQKVLRQNLRLSGEAVIGQQQPIQILAVPAEPPPAGQ